MELFTQEEETKTPRVRVQQVWPVGRECEVQVDVVLNGITASARLTMDEAAKTMRDLARICAERPSRDVDALLPQPLEVV